MERRLAAVLIADVVGYSRMSEVDEEGTRVRFHADLHQLFEPKIATHHGRLVKTMGDGVLVEFHSVVDAVHCAVELQREKAERNASLPLEQRMIFRIGAAKNPSPGYYTLLAGKLNMMQRSDEAIAAAERAIALDASDPSNYESLSMAMIFNGRAEDGLGYLDAAARVDPAWSRWRYLLAGLAYFSMNRFEQAVVALEKTAPESKETSYWDFWSSYPGLMVLISAYGQLDRHADAAAARERLKPYLAQAQVPEYTGLTAAVEFPFKNYVDLERVLAGLRKAGVPELPDGFNPKPEDRLDGDAIRALLFGHEIQGRNIKTGEAYRRVTAPDGTTVITVGEWSDQGAAKSRAIFSVPSIRRGGVSAASFPAIPTAPSRKETSIYSVSNWTGTNFRW
jgi:tetratricopeptide (TPR) repeat protein